MNAIFIAIDDESLGNTIKTMDVILRAQKSTRDAYAARGGMKRAEIMAAIARPQPWHPLRDNPKLKAVLGL